MNNVNRKKIIWYIVIFSFLVTVLAFMAPSLGGNPSSPGAGFIVWATAPLGVSLLMRAVTRDWSDLGIKPAIRKNARWYILSVLAYPVTMVLTVIASVLFTVVSVSGFSIGRYLQTALIALPIFFVFAIFEEVGWRGYLAPKLAALGINSYLAAALLAVVWTAWHVPYLRDLMWVYTNSEDLLTFIPRYYLLLFALAILYGEVRSIAGTFWPAVLIHAMANSFGHPLVGEYVKVVSGQEALGSISTGLFMIAFSALLGIAINRWRIYSKQIHGDFVIAE